MDNMYVQMNIICCESDRAGMQIGTEGVVKNNLVFSLASLVKETTIKKKSKICAYYQKKYTHSSIFLDNHIIVSVIYIIVFSFTAKFLRGTHLAHERDQLNPVSPW
jgi:hypothetical protein